MIEENKGNFRDKVRTEVSAHWEDKRDQNQQLSQQMIDGAQLVSLYNDYMKKSIQNQNNSVN